MQQPILLMLVCAAFAQAALWNTVTESQILKEVAPWFCHDQPCPAYIVETTTPSYEIRTYDAATWAALNVSNAGSRVEFALAKALVPLTRYVKGSNSDEAAISAGKPIAVAFEPIYKFTELADNFTVSFYLPEAKPPAPKDENITILHSPADSQVYVYQFGGFATTSSILSSAAKLATALEADNLDYDGSRFIFAAYDQARIFDRHNEIWAFPKYDYHSQQPM